jgi:hypothetical protein
MKDIETGSAEVVRLINSLPTTNALFYAANGSTAKARLPCFTEALGAYSIARHVLKTLSENPKRGLDIEEAKLLSTAATKLVELESGQTDAKPDQRMDLMSGGKPVSSLLFDIMDKSPSRDLPSAGRRR